MITVISIGICKGKQYKNTLFLDFEKLPLKTKITKCRWMFVDQKSDGPVESSVTVEYI